MSGWKPKRCACGQVFEPTSGNQPRCPKCKAAAVRAKAGQPAKHLHQGSAAANAALRTLLRHIEANEARPGYDELVAEGARMRNANDPSITHGWGSDHSAAVA